MNILTNSANKNLLSKKLLIGLLAFVTALGIMSAINPPKAQAAWVNRKPYDFAMLSKYCGTQYTATNFQNRPDTWHCYPKYSGSLPFWVHPGTACRKVYGSSTFSFIVTSWTSKYGGYCAQWG